MEAPSSQLLKMLQVLQVQELETPEEPEQQLQPAKALMLVRVLFQCINLINLNIQAMLKLSHQCKDLFLLGKEDAQATRRET